MKQKKDTRFWLTTFSEEQEQTKHEYKSFKREIENNGCFKVKTETDTVKIYTPELAVIFTSKELPSRNMDTQTETNINGWEYLKTYIEAYKEGEQYFETEFKVSPNTLYGVNAEQYVRDIHLNFFHVKHTGINEGWGYVKKQYPIILTHKAVKEFGYYSGIVNKMEEQVEKYPRLFATFDKCEHKLPPRPIKTKADILKEQLSQYGFFELEKVKTLSEQSKVSIIEKIAESGLPYAIAMFDYLEFIPYLEKKHFDSKYKLNREVSKWFDSDKDGRAVKGNISSLLKNTTENKDRYTAYKHKENVIKDYELLK